MDENAYALGMQVATLVTEMKHVREDLGEIRRAVSDTLPALDKRVTKLESAPALEARVEELEKSQLMWKGRAAGAAAVAAPVGGVVAWLLERWLK